MIDAKSVEVDLELGLFYSLTLLSGKSYVLRIVQGTGSAICHNLHL